MDNRIDNALHILTTSHLDAVLISSVSNIFYLTQFSGFSKEEREAFLLLTEKQNYIFTDGRYKEVVKKTIKDFILVEVGSGHIFKDELKKIALENNLHTIGFEANNLSVTEYAAIKKGVKKFVPVDITTVRMQKDEDELSSITKACKLTDATFDFILKKIKPGVLEQQIAREIEYFIKDHNASLSFPSIVAFGPHTSQPHHQSSGYKLITNNYILLDFGAKVDGYASDMTRTIFFGKPTSEQRQVYETVKKAQELTIDWIVLNRARGDATGDSFQDKPARVPASERSERGHRTGVRNGRTPSKEGILASDVDKVAREYIVEQRYPLIPHSLGHGVGIDVHEAPRLSPNSKDVLGPGMVFTIEPGIYLPDEFGVRIEDTAVLTKDGLQILTKSPKELITI